MHETVAVITGGASGLGEATSRRLVERGGRAVIADVQDDRGRALAETLGDRTIYRRTDVTVEDDVAGAIDAAVETFGRLDCMFNNAGIVGAVGPIDQTPLDEYEYTMAVLLRSVFLGMKHAARVMKPAGRGVILSTSSVAGVMGGLGPHVYAAAKAAVIGLTRNAASELGRYGIRVNAIVPGSIATPMVADVRYSDPTATDALLDALREESPVRGHAASPDDIAEAALWLMSDAAGFVNGHALVVDGGQTIGARPANAPPASRFTEHQPLLREGGRRGV